MTETVRKFAGRIDCAAKKLVSVEHFLAASMVSMPVIYPSGASVVLEVSQQGDRVYVSDRGGGFQEAEYINATRLYAKEAERVATEAGIKFDGRDMFVAEVSASRIEGAMTVVASCSAQAANVAALRSADREQRDAKERLFDRLTEVFGPAGYEKDARLLGASNHRWRVDALVQRHDTLLVFNSVTGGYISAAGTVAKFHDLARLEMSPRRIAVIPSRVAMGDWYGVIRPAADDVLEMSAANDQFAYNGIAA